MGRNAIFTEEEKKERARKAMIKWREENRERVNEIARKSRNKHKNKINEKMKDEYKKNPQKYKDFSKSYYERNKNKINEYDRNRWEARRERENNRRKENYKNNIERERKARQNWEKNNPNKRKEYSVKKYRNNKDTYYRNSFVRRERKKLNGETITLSVSFKTDIMNKFNNRCFKCNSSEKLEIDHHYPLSKGNAISSDNAVLLCMKCNRSKSNKMPEQFYTEEELLNLQSCYAIKKHPTLFA